MEQFLNAYQAAFHFLIGFAGVLAASATFVIPMAVIAGIIDGIMRRRKP